MSTSEPEAEELRPLITPPAEQRRPSNWSLGCLCTVISLQVVCLIWMFQISKDAESRFHVDSRARVSWIAGSGIIYLYSLPILAALYTDIVLGRYRTLLFAIGLQTAGSLLTLIAIIVCEAEQSVGHVVLRISLAIWFIGITWIMTGILVALFIEITFSMQQVEQTIPALSRMCRWVTVAIIAGYSGGYLVDYFDMLTLFGVFGERYSGTVSHAVFLAVECCSVAVFLCGKTNYRHTDSRTDDGKKSWKEFVRIIRTYVFCRKSQNEGNHMDDLSRREERTRAEELVRKRLDRLKLKKGVLMIALLSCSAVTLSMSYTGNLIFNFPPLCWRPEWEKQLVKGILCITPIIGVFAFEIIRKYSEHHLWQNSCVNILKTIGVGSGLAALSVTLAGAVATLVITKHEVISPLWLIPSNFLMGLMLIVVYPSLMVLCYRESLPGMETVLTALAASLSVFYGLIALVFVLSFGASGEPKQSYRFDYVFYGLAGAMVVVVVALYTPISIMYIKTSRAIQEAEESLDDTTSQETVALIGD